MTLAHTLYSKLNIAILYRIYVNKGKTDKFDVTIPSM